VCAEVGEVLEVVESKHGPALRALYVEKMARGRGRALERDEPLDRRQQACQARTKLELCTLVYINKRGKRAHPIGPRECARPR
jgi:hypothetical protein